MIVHSFSIPYEYGQTITLKPLFDVHYGNKYCDTYKLRDYLQERDERTYLIGGGDLIDAVIVKDTKRYMKATDAMESDAIIDEQIDGLYKYLEPYKGKIIGLGSGNHEDTILKHCSTSPIRRLAEKLETTPLGMAWFCKLSLRESDGRGRTLVIFGHHGWGAGCRTAGGSITKYTNASSFWDADIFLFGHDHQRKADRIERISLSGNKMITKPRYIFLCGTFLKTYSNTDVATYSEAKGYPPVSLGGLNISCKPNREWIEITNDI